MTNNAMPDVQSSHDPREQRIDQVGIKALKHPLTFIDGENHADTIAECMLTVGLPAERKGTHMSRFVAMLNEQTLQISLATLPDWVDAMLERLDASSGVAEFSFPYFVSKPAPVSGQPAMMDYEVTLRGEVDAAGHKNTRITVVVPVTSLCPCSKEISAYGAHNQRSHITVSADVTDATIPLQHLIAQVEEQGSCPLWGLLKRPDEKYITERAFDQPKFVEDIVRDVATCMENQPGVDRFTVSVENFESIHNHSAWAVIEQHSS